MYKKIRIYCTQKFFVPTTKSSLYNPDVDATQEELPIVGNGSVKGPFICKRPENDINYKRDIDEVGGGVLVLKWAPRHLTTSPKDGILSQQ